MNTHAKKIIALAILIVTTITFGFSQNVTISGIVKSAEDKQTIPGVIVQVTGSKTGVQADLNGHYTITVPAEAKSLSFSFMGYVTKEVAIESQTTIDVNLVTDKKLLNEVVAVGYGVQNKRDVTGSISTIKSDAIRNLPVQSFDQALAGKAAGVNITIPNGVLNNVPVIRIRGYNSITSSSYPLIVIDGIPMTAGSNLSNNSSSSNPLGDINPDDIESIDILKDASATAIYGSRAANGVMLITTKKGKEGKAKVSYNAWVGITQPFNPPKILNAEQYMMLKNEAARNANMPESFFPSYNPDGSMVDTRWYDFIYRTGVAHNNSLSISGATPETSYYFSLGYSKQNGFIDKNEFKRAVIRFNIDQKIGKRIKVGTNASYTKGYNQAPNTGSLPNEGFTSAGAGRLAFMSPPNVSPYGDGAGGYNITSSNTIGAGANKVAITSFNPLALIDLNRFTSENDHILASIFGELQIIDGLTFRTTYLADLNGLQGVAYLSNKHGDGFTANGSVTNVNSQFKRTGWTNTLFYQKQFHQKHNLSLLGGIEEVFSTTDRWGGSRQNIADDFFQTYQGNFLINNPPTTTNLQAENVFLSYFGRATYDFDKKYFVTASLRRDGFSGLSKGNKFGNFGGASLGWSVSEEKFYKESALSRTMNSVKVRTSFGKVGNIGVPNYGSLSLYNSDLYADVNTIAFVQAGNPTLKWETSTKFDIGLEMNFLKDRLQLEIGYFNNNINGLVLNAPQAPSKGVPTNTILQNIGSMYNKGVEFNFTTTNVDKGDFLWTSNINYAFIKNEVTSLGPGDADIVGTTASLEKTNITRVGYSVGSLYAVKTASVNPDNGQRIYINKNGDMVQYNHVVAAGKSKWTYLDGSTAPAISAEDAVIIGNTLPKWYGGFNNTFTYKNMLDLNIGITFSGGNYIYNGTRAGLLDQRFWNNGVEVLDRWTYEGQKTDIPRVVYGDNISNGSSFPISDNIEKGDFLKFKSIALGYRFGKNFLSKTKIASLRMYVQVTNLYTLTKYTGSDPEISVNGNINVTPGIDRNSVPQARTFTFGLNLDL